MAADDRARMSEEMADFWAEVVDALPPLLKNPGFVSAHPMGGLDSLEIFTNWWNQWPERIATLRLPAGRVPALVADKPGTDSAPPVDVDAKQVADAIVEAAADQVRKHLPGVQGTGPAFEWGGKIIASFDDAGCGAQNMGGFVEYAQRRADRALHREATLAVIDLLMCEGVPFTMASFLPRGRGLVAVGDRHIWISTDRGRTKVTSTGLDDESKGSVEITRGSRGVEYLPGAMEALIQDAAGRAR